MKYHFLSLLLLFALLSCKKDESSGTTSTKLIKREIAFFRENPHIKHVRHFAYDSAKRCAEIKIGTIDSSITNPVFTLRQTLTFHYDALSSNLPSSVSSVRTIFPHLTTNFYYQYNSQGRKIKDSVSVKNLAGEPADRVIHYVYDNNRVYTTPVFTGFPMENAGFDTISLFKGDNIQKLTSRLLSLLGDQIITYTFTYDQAVNPYNKLNIANSLYFQNGHLGLGYNVPLETHYIGVNSNNMTSWTSGSYTAVFKYSYDRDKYPVRKEMILPEGSNPYQTILFEY
jgi:hypothetical protein